MMSQPRLDSWTIDLTQTLRLGATAAALACLVGCGTSRSSSPTGAGGSAGTGGSSGAGAQSVDAGAGGSDAAPAPRDAAVQADRAPPAGYVHADGARLLDGSGNPLLLRTAALGNWLLNEGYMWTFRGAAGDRGRRMEQRFVELVGPTDAAAFWQGFRDGYVTQDDFARISSLGFNSVRVAMNARLLLPEGQSSFDENEFRRLQDVVDWGTEHGVYIIFDMHGAPGGQTGTNIDDDANDNPDLFTNVANQDRLVALWAEIARRFAERTIVLGYDLLNEPLPGTAPNFLPLYRAQLWPLYQRVGAAIRAVDGNHVLIVEGGNWANDWSTLGPPFDSNMMYSFHKYCFGCSAADLAASETVSSIQTFLNYRRMWDRPIWCGEAGENTNAWYGAVYQMFEDNDVGWTFWTWKKARSTNNPYSVTLPAGWAAIQTYIQASTPNAGAAALPPMAASKATLDQFLLNIRLQQNTFNQAVLCSLPAAISSRAGCP
jgi:hypothetical protein